MRPESDRWADGLTFEFGGTGKDADDLGVASAALFSSVGKSTADLSKALETQSI